MPAAKNSTQKDSVDSADKQSVDKQSADKNSSKKESGDNATIDKSTNKSSAKNTDKKGADNKKRLTQVLLEIEPSSSSGKVSVGDIMHSLESRGFGPLLFAPALIAVMPTGGIPGVPSVCGSVIVVLSGQMLVGKTHPWFPSFIDNIDFDKEKLKKGVDMVSKLTKQIDKVTHPRIEKLSSPMAKKAIALVCIVSALAMMPLELVPFAVMIPASAIILLSIGLITKDGVVIIAALLLNLATFYFVFTKAVDMVS